MMMKNTFKYTCLGLLLATLSVSTAVAQNKSARGMSSNAAQESACLDELVRIDDRLDDLDNFAGRLESCNANGQTFDGTNCIDLAGITHEWLPNTNNPTTLVLYSNGTEVDRISVIRGDDGISRTAADCPVGTTSQ